MHIQQPALGFFVQQSGAFCNVRIVSTEASVRPTMDLKGAMIYHLRQYRVLTIPDKIETISFFITNALSLLRDMYKGKTE